MSIRKSTNDAVVIGGGAAGMLAAVTAAARGLRVVLVEKNQRLGKKLAITGKGRCNVTNDSTPQEIMKNIPRNGSFLYSSLAGFDARDAMDFFEAHGCPLKVERGKRVFPVSDRSGDVIAALHRALEETGVRVEQGTVRQILVREGRASGVLTDRGPILAGSVILATGGVSYPLTGSTGDGYPMAAALGHTVVPPEGSLVPLCSPCQDCLRLQGLSLRNTGFTLLDEKNKAVFQEQGELLFTHFGLSGPMTLSASAHMQTGKTYTVRLDLKPALDPGKLDARILRDLEKYCNRTMENALSDLYPASLIPVMLDRAGIDPGLKANSLPKARRKKLGEETKAFRIPVSGLRPVEEAIITRGGICVREVNPKTMESKLVPGLYFAGEILDCDAYTGGFNLQIAWSTAHAAGTACPGSADL